MARISIPVGTDVTVEEDYVVAAEFEQTFPGQERDCRVSSVVTVRWRDLNGTCRIDEYEINEKGWLVPVTQGAIDATLR